MAQRLQAARREVDAARRGAERGVEGGRGAQVHQLVGDLGPPARDVEVGQLVGRVEQRGAQRAVGLADVRQLRGGGRERLPVDGLAEASRHQAQRAR